jgi:eukaryotic-like serine/threonine-protein kinase
MPGQILDERYEVEQQLGRQSGRWTLLAKDLVTEELVILKVLCVDDELLPGELSLFEREMATLQSLNHPATPKYLGYFELELPKSGKALTSVQSYIAGRSLKSYLEQGRIFTQTEVQQIAASILQILGDIHSHEPAIIHRDIKPSNILLADELLADKLLADEPSSPEQSSPEQPRSRAVYLIDFGTVRLTPSSSTGEFTSMTVIGTDGYTPPEQLGRRAVRASDLYSLGMTLITALTGQPPDQLPRRFDSQIDLPQALPTCSPALITWLTRLTEPELQQRFDSAQSALAALAEISH